MSEEVTFAELLKLADVLRPPLYYVLDDRVVTRGEVIRHEMGLVERLESLERTLGRVLGVLERVLRQIEGMGPKGALRSPEALSGDQADSAGLDEMLGGFRSGA